MTGASTEAEVVVIGGGPGGYAAAFRAAECGRDVTLVTDEENLGGVCLQRGCIPSKTLLHIVDLVLGARAGRRLGVDFGEPSIDIAQLRKAKTQVIGDLAAGLRNICDARGISIVEGHAEFADPRTLRVVDGGEGQVIRFDKAIIATGSEPTALDFLPFGGPVWDSAAALELEQVPETLLVVGGGFIGLELGMVYACLGSKVTLIERDDRLLPGADADLVAPIADVVGDLFADVRTSTSLDSAEAGDDAVEAVLAADGAKEKQRFDRALLAIGRIPSTDRLQLDAAEIETDSSSAIGVDAELRTSNQRVFAVGDVIGGAELAHEAIYEGKIAAEVIAGYPSAYDARAVPAVVYTRPQLAWCGMTEHTAETEGRDLRIERFPWRASGRAHSVGAENGLTKLLLDPDTGRVLGVGVVGQDAEHLIAEGVLAIEMGATAEDLARAIHAHPTLSETIGEAAGRPLGMATHLGPDRSTARP